MKKILLVIDVQNDFVWGDLGSPDAQKAAEKVAQLVADERFEVIATVGHHYPKPRLRTIEAEAIPPHCIAHSLGAALYGDIAKHVDYVIKKNCFACDHSDIRTHLQTIFTRRSSEVLTGEEGSPREELFICGLYTDVCVISNALMLRSIFPHVKITVLADACAGTYPEMHEAALAVMKSCLIDIKDSATAFEA
jgi:nicotinamidase-related amidase